jgi:hypothetical protein
MTDPWKTGAAMELILLFRRLRGKGRLRDGEAEPVYKDMACSYIACYGESPLAATE